MFLPLPLLPPDVLFPSSAEIQLHRLMKRDNSTREDASARLNSQLSITEKIKYADVVIDNSGTQQELEREIGSIIKKLRDDAGWSWRDRKSTRLNSSHSGESRMPSSA